MQLKKKIFSFGLLAIYLLVLVHHSVAHSHGEIIADAPQTAHTHIHDGDDTGHHHHHKDQIDIFHFLGHLFENVNHSNDLEDEHLIIAQSKLTLKVFEQYIPVNLFLSGIEPVFFEVDAESIPDPPRDYLPNLQRLKSPATPLRAPPARA